MAKGSRSGFGGVVTGNGIRRGPSPVSLVAGGVVMLALLGGGFYLFSYGPLAHKQTPATNTSQLNLTPVEAIAQAETQVKNANTPAEKQTAYTTLGDAYAMSDKTSQSESAYQQALTYSPNDLILLEMLAESYDSAGDTTDAVKTLNKLITAINAANPPDKDWLLSRYQAELKHDSGGN